MAKTNELSTKQCGKCDCRFVPGQENCFKINQNPDQSSTEGLVIPANCHETIKIYVKGVCRDDDRSSYATQTSSPAVSKLLEQSKTIQTEAEKYQPKEKPQVEPSANKNLQTEAAEDTESSQFNCFGWCGKKKKKTEVLAEKENQEEVSQKTDKPPETKDNLEQTLNLDANVGDNSRGPQKPPTPRVSPKDKSKGDGYTSLETFLRMEAKINRMNLEDILTELHKQKRDLNELKEMLDMVARSVREQLFISTFGKGKNELIDDMCRKNNLERKSNSLSLTEQVSEVIPPPKRNSLTYKDESGKGSKKKKRFPWCL